MLGITAHPDDEAGAFGGSLLLYHSRGVETYVVCLTSGQAATNRGKARSDEELAVIRRAEFAESCRVLRVTRAEILNYPDGALDRATVCAARCLLVEDACLRRAQPSPLHKETDR